MYSLHIFLRLKDQFLLYSHIYCSLTVLSLMGLTAAILTQITENVLFGCLINISQASLIINQLDSTMCPKICKKLDSGQISKPLVVVAPFLNSHI